MPTTVGNEIPNKIAQILVIQEGNHRNMGSPIVIQQIKAVHHATQNTLFLQINFSAPTAESLELLLLPSPAEYLLPCHHEFHSQS